MKIRYIYSKMKSRSGGIPLHEFNLFAIRISLPL
jgi:hypothetical protein